MQHGTTVGSEEEKLKERDYHSVPDSSSFALWPAVLQTGTDLPTKSIYGHLDFTI